MGDAENEFHPSKKRAAGREISRDNPGLDDDEDTAGQEIGTFKRASDEVLAARRIVKVRRQPNPPASSSNPFAKISLIPPPQPEISTPSTIKDGNHLPGQKLAEEVDSESQKGMPEAENSEKGEQLESNSGKKVSDSSVNEEKNTTIAEESNPNATDEEGKESEDNGEKGEERENNSKDDTDPSGATAPLSSFQQMSSTQNAFTGLTGTGFSTSFSFGSIPKEGSASGASTGSQFGLMNGKPPSFPPLNLGNSNNGFSLFGTSSATNGTKNEKSGTPSMQEVPVETGEENEKAVFTADAVLFEYLDGGWKERGKGELKVNVSTTIERARLIMRARGNYRLILNASLYPDMKLTNMDKKGITFACINSSTTGEQKDKNELSTFALKFKDASIVEEFCVAVTEHKDKKATVLKTPENSPKASDD